MTTTFRLVAGFAVLFLAHATALAEPPVAPPPHPTLDELVKEYKRYDLPIPPATAELVRIEWFNSATTPYALGFRYQPKGPRTPVRYVLGYWLVTENEQKAEAVKPVPAILDRASEWNWLGLAIQCKIRGYNDLAAALYAEARRGLQDHTRGEPLLKTTHQELRRIAWMYWEQQLVEQNSDRKVIWKHLRGLADEDPDMLAQKDWFTLDCLKLTLAPRNAKPNSPEALIDELTDYWDDPHDFDNETGHAAYEKLAKLGFEAVPALIDHLEDKRLTRSSGRAVTELSPRIIRVGELVSGLLDGLADGALGAEDAWWFYGTFASPKVARKWWAQAQKIGEERWLIEHVIPAKDFDQPDAITKTNGLILELIAAKYPNRLLALYQTILLKRPRVESEKITSAIVGSTLPLKQKIALLKEGASHANYSHRYNAINAISSLDKPTFEQYLIATLEHFPSDDVDAGPYYTPPELRIVALIGKTDSRLCWNALATATARTSPQNRLEFIDITASDNEPIGRHRERIRYLLGLLNDSSVGIRGQVAEVVRDRATIELSRVLTAPNASGNVLPRTPRELSLLRDRVRELAERELARPTR